jgi:hypothetical protein
MNVGEQSMNGGKSVVYNKEYLLFEVKNPDSVLREFLLFESFD